MDIPKFRTDLKNKDFSGALSTIQKFNQLPDTFQDSQFEQLFPNLPDEDNEMSLFMHVIFTKNLNCIQACLQPYLKNKKLVRKIVNFTCHQHLYTPLMMAVITGSLETVQFLMKHGADKTSVNKINKTACELAAFTGQNEIAAFISNYFDVTSNDKLYKNFSKEELDLLSETNLAPANLALNYLPLVETGKIDKGHLKAWVGVLAVSLRLILGFWLPKKPLAKIP